MTVIYAFYLLGCVLDNTGKPATFASLISGFEMFFNVKLPRPYRKSEDVIKHLGMETNFLRRMIRTLTEKSGQ